MKENLKSKRGITLIALIITIIILLILAMVTINILINQGIIGHANNAVRGYEVAEEKELISLAYQNYKMDKLNDSSAELSVDGATALRDEDINGWYITFTKTKHNYTLAEDGTVADSKERWIKNGDTITKGDYTLKIGDYVAYDHTKDTNGNDVAIQSYTSYSAANASADKNNGRTSGASRDQVFSIGSYSGGWQVLGVKSGKIQLVSTGTIKPDTGGNSSFYGYYSLYGQRGYTDGIDELNAIASIYGQGRGAAGARSINVDDINGITGYNPAKTGNGEPYGKGEIWEYGQTVTCYWKGDRYRYYEGTNGVKGSLTIDIRQMYCYEDGTWKVSRQSTTATDTPEGREKIMSFKNTSYAYNVTTLTGDSGDEIKGLKPGSKLYDLLSGKKYQQRRTVTILACVIRNHYLFSGNNLWINANGR